MTDQEKLYETLGELLYVVAMADGVIQSSEIDAMKEILKDHTWAENVNWSFNYEARKHHSVEEVYAKAIDFCKQYGPAPEYAEFISAMNLLATASDGIDSEESRVINNFSRDLIEKFKRDLEEED